MQDTLYYKTLDVISAISGVPVEDIQSPVKKRIVSNAKRMASKVLSDSGYGATEIAYILHIDRKSVYDYIKTHETWMDKESYRKSYYRVVSLVDDFTDEESDLKEEVDKLKVKVRRLEDMYDHIKQLILS